MEILKYKGYEGTAELDMSQNICRGRILFIKDLVTYKSDSPAELEQQFRNAVDDYLETCKELGRDPAKPFKGQFNVRVAPQLHRSASLRAAEQGITLNEVVVKALDSYLCVSPEVNHNFYVTISEQGAGVKRFSSSASDDIRWNDDIEIAGSNVH